MPSANIIAVFKDEKLKVKIDIRLISDNTLVIDRAEMTEMADGAYKYIFDPYDETLDYLFICKNEYGDKVFAKNERKQDQMYTSLEGEASIVDNHDGSKTVTVYDIQDGRPKVQKKYKISESQGHEEKHIIDI